MKKKKLSTPYEAYEFGYKEGKIMGIYIMTICWTPVILFLAFELLTRVTQ